MKSSIKRTIASTLLGVFIFCGSAVPAYAAKRTCSYSGCEKAAKSGTWYCTTHGCHFNGCIRGALSDSNYCSTHTCHKNSCNNGVVSISSHSGGRYCSLHTCSELDCYEFASSEGKCYKHKSDSSSKSASMGKKSTNKKSSSTTTSWHSYDDGYEAIYDDDDYDEERYEHDSEYAAGVDDAIDELDW